MTIDEMIAKLEAAKAVLPSGGRAEVTFSDMLIVRRVHPSPGFDAVIITDQDENGETIPLSWLRQGAA